MKNLALILFLLSTQVLSAAHVTLTAYNSMNGAPGSLEIAIDPTYNYPNFSILVTGPNNFSWSVNNSPNFNHTINNLAAGEYSVSVTNGIGCIASDVIEVLKCFQSGGGGIFTMVLCEEKHETNDGGLTFYMASPNIITKGGTLTDVEFRQLSSRSLSPNLQSTALSQGMQIIYDLQLYGSTQYDIPYQNEVQDENLNLIIKYNSSGQILWVYHKESDSNDAGLRVEPDQKTESIQYSLECKAMPNPFAGSLDVQLIAPVDGPVKLQLFDMNGRIILESSLECEAGVAMKHTIRPEISSGIYVLKALDLIGNSKAVQVIKI